MIFSYEVQFGTQLLTVYSIYYPLVFKEFKKMAVSIPEAYNQYVDRAPPNLWNLDVHQAPIFRRNLGDACLRCKKVGLSYRNLRRPRAHNWKREKKILV